MQEAFIALVFLLLGALLTSLRERRKDERIGRRDQAVWLREAYAEWLGALMARIESERFIIVITRPPKPLPSEHLQAMAENMRVLVDQSNRDRIIEDRAWTKLLMTETSKKRLHVIKSLRDDRPLGKSLAKRFEGTDSVEADMATYEVALMSYRDRLDRFVSSIGREIGELAEGHRPVEPDVQRHTE